MASRTTFIFTISYFAVIVALLVFLWWPDKAKVDWPAWVQAIGSIAAILVAIWVSHWESERARKMVREDLYEIRSAVAGLAREMANEVDRLATSFKGQPAYHAYEGASYSTLNSLEIAISQFAPSTLRSGEAVLALQRLNVQINRAESIEQLVSESYIHGPQIASDGEDIDPVEIIESWQQAVRELVETLERTALQAL